MSEENQIQPLTEKGSDIGTNLALERTELALERTHLAWIRTMFTLITAGLAIDKGFELIHKQRLMTGEAWIANGHFVGIALTAFSTILLLTEAIQFVKRSRELSERRKKKFPFFSAGLVLAMLVMLLGVTLTLFMILSG